MRTKSTNTRNPTARRASAAAIHAHRARRAERVAGRATATAAATTYPPHWSQPSKRTSKPGEERTPGMVVTAKATTTAASRAKPAHTAELAC